MSCKIISQIGFRQKELCVFKSRGLTKMHRWATIQVYSSGAKVGKQGIFRIA